MKKVYIIVLILFIGTDSFTQELSQVKFAGGANLNYFSFTTDQKIIIRISADGNILEWGNLWDRGYYNYYPGKLQKYMGRVEYYGSETDSINRGKVKSIGTCYITYYGPFEIETKIGKIKAIGRTYLDYFSHYENDASIGKLKAAGNTQLSYYSSFDNEAIRGKLKSVGTNIISYYTTFDDKVLKGKIKSIGTVSYSWYNSNDRREYQGTLKSNSVEQVIGGINYIVQ